MSIRSVSVFGATGAQGGSVARALLKDNKWKVVALTRDVNSDKAKELKSMGAELRACNMLKPEDVEAAVKGSYAVFAMTDFFSAQGGKENEIKQGENIINACKKHGVQHVVLSGLESALKISEGKREVGHFESKDQVQEYLMKSGVPYTIVQPSAYYENFKDMVRPNKEGQLEFSLPIARDNKWAQFAVSETGLVVHAVLNDREKYLGKKIALVAESSTPTEVAEILSKQFGKPVKYNQVSEEVFASFPIPGAEELASMFCFFDQYGVYGEKRKNNTRDIYEGKAIVPELSTLAQWAKDWKM